MKIKKLNKKQKRIIKDIVIFAILLFSFHYIYIFWSKNNFYPLQNQVNSLFDKASVVVTNQSDWILTHIFKLPHTTEGVRITVDTVKDHTFTVEVSPGCTTLKQWLHWIFLMLLFPGPAKHKLWYIPLGLVAIHIANLIRITGLTLIVTRLPYHFDFFHNYVFKTFFYFVIFVMWLIWAEKIKRK